VRFLTYFEGGKITGQLVSTSVVGHVFLLCGL